MLNNALKIASAFLPDKTSTAYTGSYIDRVFDPTSVQLKNDALQAKINRDWQERMSNTAYQRATEDMRKAGLNPYLAYQQGGASTPTGASASGMNYGTSQAFMRLVGTALDIASMAVSKTPSLQPVKSNLYVPTANNGLIDARRKYRF